MKNLKKTMIRVGLVTGIITGLVSCDDKIRELQDLSAPPSFLYFRSSSTNWETPEPGKPIVDSAKVWTKDNNASYPFLLKVAEPQYNFARLTIKASEPQASMFINDKIFADIFEVTTNQDYNMAFKSPVASTQDFRIVSQEIFDRTNEMTVRVVFKENRGPLAKLGIILSDGGLRQYQLNASGSYDVDRAIGGAIMEYEYIIDNIIINTSESKISHVFAKGQHNIRLRVMDNDRVWSDYTQQTLTVN